MIDVYVCAYVRLFENKYNQPGNTIILYANANQFHCQNLKIHFLHSFNWHNNSAELNFAQNMVSVSKNIWPIPINEIFLRSDLHIKRKASYDM